MQSAHLLEPLLDDDSGVTRPIFSEIGEDPEVISREVNQILQSLPSVQGSPGQQTYLSHELRAVINVAEKKRTAIWAMTLPVWNIFYSEFSPKDPEGKYQTLEKYGTDLTTIARKGNIDPIIGRDEEIRRVMQILSRRTKNNPVLIGEPDVGKTAIAEGLARRIVSGDPPE